jgi:hypothetical protein
MALGGENRSEEVLVSMRMGFVVSVDGITGSSQTSGVEVLIIATRETWLEGAELVSRGGLSTGATRGIKGGSGTTIVRSTSTTGCLTSCSGTAFSASKLTELGSCPT